MRERDYQLPWCAAAHGTAEVVIPGGRIDCLTATHAIEFDWAAKWAESIGQARYYARITGHKPGVVLILKKPEHIRYLKNLATAIEADPLDWSLWIVWGW